MQKTQILNDFEFVCLSSMPKQNKLRGDKADMLPQESNKANKAKIEPSLWRCRYCKSALVRFGLASSLRRHVSTIHFTILERHLIR